uniref:Uncharacterized protein n=1 Tax=Arundo donax TaxID=35708 RepID=A0A0A9FZ89_ARUDO
MQLVNITNYTTAWNTSGNKGDKEQYSLRSLIVDVGQGIHIACRPCFVSQCQLLLTRQVAL